MADEDKTEPIARTILISSETWDMFKESFEQHYPRLQLAKFPQEWQADPEIEEWFFTVKDVNNG